MSARCDLHELENCALCNGDVAKLESSTREPLTSVLAASYAGYCGACGKPVEVGDLIGIPPGGGRWVRMKCCGIES